MIITSVFAQEYNRKDWKHWVDGDKNGLDTRQEVLIAENIAPDSLTVYDSTGKIVEGLWVCPYTGDSITNPRKLDIDHLVPLKEAHISGGITWSKEKKEAFANELFYSDNHLMAVSAKANRSKGAKDPSKWMPSINKCWYINSWIEIKKRWALEMDIEEEAFIDVYLESKCYCED